MQNFASAYDRSGSFSVDSAGFCLPVHRRFAPKRDRSAAMQ